MEKMLSFEEWDNETFVRNIAKFDEDQRRACFEAARVGMIPASEAVRIPPVNEWPRNNEDGMAVPGIGVVYTICEDEKDFRESWGICAIQYIPRPKPSWTPKVGDAVFTNGVDGEGVLYAVVKMVREDGIDVIFPDGDTGCYGLDRVKPGDTKCFGKPWREIPGSVE